MMIDLKLTKALMATSKAEKIEIIASYCIFVSKDVSFRKLLNKKKVRALFCRKPSVNDTHN